MTESEVDALAKGFGPIIRRYVRQELGKITAELAKLRKTTKRLDGYLHFAGSQDDFFDFIDYTVLQGTNALRKDLNMPTVRPRVRVKATTAPWR